MEPRIREEDILSKQYFGQGIHRDSSNNLLAVNSAQLSRRNVMLGLGFGQAGVPVDILALLLAARSSKQLTLVIVDEFAAMNGVPRDEIESQVSRLQDALGRLQAIYKLPISALRCSSFMNGEHYLGYFRQVRSTINQHGLESQLLRTVPERYRNKPLAVDYPLHEIAVTGFLREALNLEVKLGPSKELLYDTLMRKIGIDLEFAYAVDALPLATKQPTSVVHYVPNHVAKGRRLMLGDNFDTGAALLEQSHEETLRYFLRLASAAGRCLWRFVV